jgi:hypothetical protein
VPYRIAQVRSPIGPAYPILWTLGFSSPTSTIESGTSGLGCGFLKVTREPSTRSAPWPAGTIVTETVILTDAIASSSATFEELACSGGRVVPATTDPAQTGADLTPHASAARIASEWRLEIAKTPRKRAEAPSTTAARDALLARLRAAGAVYGFDVVSIRMLQGKVFAPLIVVKTADTTRLRSAMAKILARIDPHAGTKTPAYAGLFFQALNDSGAPFMAVYNWRRGGGHWKAGGSQWAADGRLPLPEKYWRGD